MANKEMSSIAGNLSATERNTNSITLAENLFAAIKTERKDDVEKYLCLGADPNLILLNGITPFHLASGCSKSFEFVRLILKHDGNPNVRDIDGITPFHVATQWGKKNCLKLLIHHGADLMLKDNDGKDIFGYAEENGIPNFAAIIQDYCLEKEKVNSPSKTVDHSFDQSQDSLSIRSPLHSLCDDSWIVKSRGSKRRHRLISERSSKENSPAKTPRDDRTKSASDCTHCKDYWKTCCIDKQTLPNHVFCNIQAHAIGPCISDGHCNNFNYVSRVCTSHQISRAKCSVCKSPAVNKSQVFSCNRNNGSRPYGISSPYPSFNCDLSHGVKHESQNTSVGTPVSVAHVQTSFSVGGDCRTDKRVMCTEDKCIGTSFMESFLQCDPAKQSKVSLNDDKLGKNTTSGFYEDAVNSSDSKMEEFVKGCQRFIDSDVPKGLDVSSPDHCESFTIDKKSELSGNLALPTRDVEVFENKTKSDSVIAGNCNPAENLLIKNDSETPCTTPKSASVVSPRKRMLFSTKIPLTFEEMVKCYGESAAKTIHSSSFLSQSRQNEPEPEATEKTFLKKDCPVKDESNFTLSDSTVPLEYSDVTANCMVQKKLIAMKEVNKKEVENTCSPVNVGLDLKGPANGLLTDITLNSTPTNLHSTAMEEPNNAIRNSFEISQIKETTADIRLHVDGISWVEEHAQSLLQNPDSKMKKQSCSVLQLSGNSNSSSQSTIIYDWKTFWKGESLQTKPTKSCSQSSASSGEESTPMENLEDLTDSQIRGKLLAYGVDPGPINPSRKFYLARLKGLMQANEDGKQTPSDAVHIKKAAEPTQFSRELNNVLFGKSLCEKVIVDDESIQRQFEQPDPNLRWREGTAKSSFTYLLLDPRVTDKLSIRAKDISELEAFRSFVGSIFYVGKGKHSRPYSHFHEALQTNAMLYKLNPSRKVRHIHDIWEAGYGVISLHIFQNVIACEAYTREAAMIDAIGLLHLTNRRRGDYYGLAASWNMERKRLLGSYLVMKAMKVLLLEGERQIRPVNLKSQNKIIWTGCQAVNLGNNENSN